MNNDNKKKNLSMSNFKDAQGNLVDPSTLSDEDKLDFYQANLLKNVIQVLEMSVSNERVFSRSKFEIMKYFHETQELIHSRNSEHEKT
jgi:hypothetical protein